MVLQLSKNEKYLQDNLQQRFVRQLIVSQAVFYVQTYLDLIYQQFKDQTADKLLKKLQSIKIGLIGCGIIGKLIINSLMFLLEWISPLNFLISSRRPESLQKYQDMGFNIFFDNETVVKEADIIFLTFTPSLDNWALMELRNSFVQRIESERKPLVISTISNLSLNKFQKVIQNESPIAFTTEIDFKILSETTEKYLQFYNEEIKYYENEISDQELIKHIIDDKNNYFVEEVALKLLIPKYQQILDTFTFVFQIQNTKHSLNQQLSLGILGQAQIEFQDQDAIIKRLEEVYLERAYNYRKLQEQFLLKN